MIPGKQSVFNVYMQEAKLELYRISTSKSVNNKSHMHIIDMNRIKSNNMYVTENMYCTTVYMLHTESP